MSNPAPENDRIVITRDEANSQHVDDLLRRQMNLRGETAFAAEPRRRWYYQNWLLFMVVGALAAFCAWLLTEPYLEDFLYVQGKIEEIRLDEAMPAELLAGGGVEAMELYGQGWVRVNGQRIWLSPGLRLGKDGKHTDPFDPAGLQPGAEVGFWTKFARTNQEDFATAHYVDPNPKPGVTTAPLRDLNRASETSGFLFFSAVAGMIGLFLGAADGLVCRVWSRAILGAIVGGLIGFVGSLVSTVVGGVLYAPITTLATQQMSADSSSGQAIGFMLQMIGRMFAWTLVGSTMGLGQGVVLRSKRILLHGVLGGVIGGMLGGLLFDPLDFAILGGDDIGADSSRLIGIVVIGAAVGAMIGVVELLTRDAWLRMVEGPLAGKEFLIFRDTMNIGASPRSEIYLFNDDQVAPTHATLRVIGDETEISARDKVHPLLINGHNVRTARLRAGDRIQIGMTSFVFEQRQK